MAHHSSEPHSSGAGSLRTQSTSPLVFPEVRAIPPISRAALDEALDDMDETMGAASVSSSASAAKSVSSVGQTDCDHFSLADLTFDDSPDAPRIRTATRTPIGSHPWIFGVIVFILCAAFTLLPAYRSARAEAYQSCQEYMNEALALWRQLSDERKSDGYVRFGNHDFPTVRDGVILTEDTDQCTTSMTLRDLRAEERLWKYDLENLRYFSTLPSEYSDH